MCVEGGGRVGLLRRGLVEREHNTGAVSSRGVGGQGLHGCDV